MPVCAPVQKCSLPSVRPPIPFGCSPYWRPAGLALAVAAVDALTWGGADPVILDELDGEPELCQPGLGEPELSQLLARAHVGRLVTEMIIRRGNEASLAVAERTGAPVTALILARLAVGLAAVLPANGEVGT